MQDIKQQKKCSHGECRACHNGVNEDNPTGQKGICPYQQREMEENIIVQDTKGNMKVITGAEFYNYILPFGWFFVCKTSLTP